jgi:integrase
MAMRVVSEGPVRITRATVDAAWRRRTPDTRIMVRDAECRGLALVVNPKGMTWRFDYRPRGIDLHTGRRWAMQGVTLGNPATHTPDEARMAANVVKGQAAAGANPAAEKRAAAEAEARRRALTLGRLLTKYEAALPKRGKLRGEGLPSAKHAAEEITRTRAALDAMDAHNRPVAELTAAHVRRVLDDAASRPATARARYGALSRFLDWCIEAGHAEANACLMVAKARRPKTVKARAHVLPLADLARLWHAAAALSHSVWRDLARFLIAVPCRRGEAAALDWRDLDLQAAEWRQAAGTTKNGEAHRLHLHPLALDLLRARHRAMGEPRAGLVFPSPEAGKPILTFSAIKRALDSAAKLTGWRWHDFRRSFATTLGEAGIAESVADAMLNHKASATRGGVLGVYQRATNWPGQVAAMQAWGAALAGAVAPSATPRPGVVVPMRRSRRAA